MVTPTVADRLGCGVVVLHAPGLLDAIRSVQFIQDSPAVRDAGECTFRPEYPGKRSRARQAQYPGKE